MQIIQSIRDKGAAIVIAVIALSLIGFLLMDARSGNARMFGFGGSSSVGKVNGSSVDKNEFNNRITIQEKQAELQGKRLSSSQVTQLKETIWEQMVKEKLFNTEAEKLGIAFTSNELRDLLRSSDPNNPIGRDTNYIDKFTGKPDPAKVNQLINNIKKPKGMTAEQRAAQDESLNQVALNEIERKFNGLLAASAFYAPWMQEKETKESKTFANISYVQLPYSLVSDSAVGNISDAEIDAYVSKNKSRFKQGEGRRVSYVSFSTLPGAADTAAVYQSILKLKPEFDTISASNARQFIGRNSSSMAFYDGYVTKNSMKMPNKDSIIGAGLNRVYGPYMDGGTYVLSKIIGSKTMPDSIKCRHILIGTKDAQTGQELMSDSSAKKLCDSIAGAIKAGADFVALCSKYSTDPGSRDKKGEYTFDLNTVQTGLAKEFGNFLINEEGKTKDVVKTMFGYHYMEILEKKNLSPAYKIAYMAKPITASDATIAAAQKGATLLVQNCRNLKDLEAYIAKNGLIKIKFDKLLKETDDKLEEYRPNPMFQQPEPPDARQIIKWAFEAKEGDVSPETYPYGQDRIIVPVLERVYKEGTMDAKDARPMAEGAVRNKKKADMIIKKAGSTFESAVVAYPGIVPPVEVKQAGADSTITFASSYLKEIGNEPKLVGVIFSKDAQSKVNTVVGNGAVYMVKVNNYAEKTPPATDVKSKQTTMQMQAFPNPYDQMKKQASIKDKRNEQY